MADCDPSRFPRNKDELLRDFEVARRMRDIRESVRLKHMLAPRWWEAAVGLLQFASAVGLLAALLQHPALWTDPDSVASQLARLVVFWLTLMVLSLVMGFEFLIFRLYHLRRAYDLLLRRVEQLERQVGSADDARPASARPPEVAGGDKLA